MKFTNLLLLSLLRITAGQLIGPVGPTTDLEDKTIECNILDYGAVADNKTDISTALETVFSECVRKHPGSRLIVPEGDYLIERGVTLINGTNWAFQLDGLITAAYGGDWNIERELLLQGFAGPEIINATINGEGDSKFLLDVLVIVNGKFFTQTIEIFTREKYILTKQLWILSSILPMARVHSKDKAIFTGILESR